MTKRAYGKSRGVTHVRIHQLAEEGKLTLVNGKIDPDVADLELQITLDPRKRMQQKLGTNGDGKPPQTEPSEAAKDAMALRRAQTRRERLKADIAEIEYREKCGELINRKQTYDAVFTLFRVTRDAILNCSPRLAIMVAAETDKNKCRKLIDKMLKTALEGLTAERLEREL